MTLSILTPPASSSLISLDQVKLYMGETTTTRDTLFRSLVLSASSDMIRYLGIHPGRTRYSESSFGTPHTYRNLSRVPVELGTYTCTLDSALLTTASAFPLALSSDCILSDPEHGVVYRPDGWISSSGTESGVGGPGVVDQYYAGYLFPDLISAWVAATVYVAGSSPSWVRPVTNSIVSPLRFECTTAGTSGASEPAWPTSLTDIGDTIADGTVVWTARAAQELPACVSAWCYSEFLRRLNSIDRAPGIASWEVEGVSESYFATQTADTLAPGVKSGLMSWRYELGHVGVS